MTNPDLEDVQFFPKSVHNQYIYDKTLNRLCNIQASVAFPCSDAVILNVFVEAMMPALPTVSPRLL